MIRLAFRPAVVLASLLLLSASLSGCAGQNFQESPVGVGRGPNDLKQSPCACETLPNLGPDPTFSAPAAS